MSELQDINLQCIAERGDDWESQWWGLWCVLESHLHAAVLSGPANSPESCNVRPLFKGILRDSFSAIEFIGHILDHHHRRAESGTLLSEEHCQLSVQDLMPRIASVSWLRLRALDFSALRDAGGVSGLPDALKGTVSLDADDDFSMHERIEEESNFKGRPHGLDYVTSVFSGDKGFELPLEPGVPLAAVEETAAIQVWPKLIQTARAYAWISSYLSSNLIGGTDALALAHERAQLRVTADHDRCVQELIDHPGMTHRIREDVVRRQYKSIMRMLFEPLDAEQLQELLGLPSVNAADKRNSKYRAARPALFPELYAEYLALEK